VGGGEEHIEGDGKEEVKGARKCVHACAPTEPKRAYRSNARPSEIDASVTEKDKKGRERETERQRERQIRKVITVTARAALYRHSLIACRVHVAVVRFTPLMFTG